MLKRIGSHGADSTDLLGLTQQAPIREVYLTSRKTRDGLFKLLFDPALLSGAKLDDEKLTDYTFKIDSVVKTAVAEYSINPAAIDKKISLKLLPLLHKEIGLENTQRLIQEVLQIVRLGQSRS